MQKLVWLIRHSQSQSNAGLPTIATQDNALTAAGQAQAQRIAQQFHSNQPPDLIVVSPYKRSRQTAQPTCNRFPHVPCEEWAVQEFTYLAADRTQNTTRHQRQPWTMAYWDRWEPAFVDGSGAESFIQLIERVWQLYENLHSTSAAFVVIFTHGLFMQAVLWVGLMRPQKIDRAAMQQFRAFANGICIENGSRLCVQLADDRIWWSAIESADAWAGDLHASI